MSFRPILSFPEYNGHRLSRTSCDLRIAPAGGVPLVIFGWKSINTSEELTPGETYGNRAKMLGRTRGKHKATADFELYAEDAEIIRLALAAVGNSQGLGYGEVSFGMMLTASEAILGGSFLWEGIGCRIQKDELAVSEGSDDQLVRKWTLHLMDMRLNGVSMVKEATVTGLPG